MGTILRLAIYKVIRPATAAITNYLITEASEPIVTEGGDNIVWG